MNDAFNRELAIERNTDPNGRVWQPIKSNPENGLWKAVFLKDGKPQVPTGLPSYLTGQFTSAEKVMVELKKFLKELWDKSDEASRNARRERVST